MPLRLQANRTLVKYKALRLITPEVANTLDIPAEAPVLCSPYVQRKTTCPTCHQEYSPLVYQLGQRTTAQHTCKYAGGGIYTIDYSSMTQPNQWVYRKGLWTVQVTPYGPIRMGHDKGFTFESVIPKRLLVPACYSCRTGAASGQLVLAGELYADIVPFDGAEKLDLVPMCTECVQGTEWSYTIDEDGQFHIHKPLTIPQGVKITL